MNRTPFRLDEEAIAKSGGQVVALDARAFGSMVALGDRPATTAVRSEVRSSGKQKRTVMVGVVSIEGPLEQRATQWMCGYSDGYDAITERFASLLADADVSAVVLQFNSPGGDAAGLMEAVRRMRSIAASAKKPVYAYADELACSAAYALATVADEIYLPASAEIGSIGCLCVHAEGSKKLEADGYKVTVVRSGKRKADANSVEPLSKDAAADLQAMVDAHAEQFAQVVAERRGGDAKKWLALEGAVFMGSAAVAAGLADGVKSFEEVVSMAIDAGAKAQEERTAARALASIVQASPELETADPDAVAGIIAAWRVGAAKAAELEAKIKAIEVADKLEAEKREAAERDELVKGAVADGRLEPSAAFADEDQASLSAAMTEMSLPSLRAFLSRLTPKTNVPAVKPTEISGAAATLTAADHAHCEAKGLDKQKFAEAKARLMQAKES